MWRAWTLDGFTWTWIVWIAVFIVVETWAILAGSQHTLTFHLRPIMVAHPLAWFLAAGMWLWLGYHFLVEPFWAWWWA